MLSPDGFQPPLQLKGEIMDLDFSLDTDHRKRRRNRTTQSCLNCHTSKRKCDRKRPCQRCIQLGLTGLCVYEIDDPALRDDPTVDETTRLRNRIAELESLVRELRGKPHPRWADANSMRDTDPSERWHSRATKCPPSLRRRDSQDDEQEGSSSFSTMRSFSKADSHQGPHNSSLYRFSSSPDPAMRYQQFPAGQTSPGYDSDRAPPYPERRPAVPYSPTSPPYGRYQAAAGAYPSPDNEAGPYTSHTRSHSGGECECRSHHAHAVGALAQQLQQTLGVLRPYAEHRQGTCALFRRMQGLNEFIQGPSSPDSVGTSSYGPGALPTPVSEGELVPSLSASSTPYNTPSSGPHSSHPGQQDWNSIAAAGFNPYFPVGPQDSEMYR